MRVRRSAGLVAGVLAAAGVALGAGSSAAVPSSAAHASGAQPMVRAVVAVRSAGSLPLRPLGGRVLSVQRHLATEVVFARPAALAQLSHDSAVLGITPDRTMHVAGYSNGGRDGVLAAASLGGRAGRPNTGAGVTVALLDTGVTDTRALNRASGRLQDGVDVSSLAAGGAARKTGAFTDGYGHGTFLASLIAGGPMPGTNGRAVGIAPAATVVVVKVADANGTTSLSEVLAGLDWVAANAQGIQIVNLALAQTAPSGPSYGADPLTAAVEHVRAAGVLVVAAAGNDASVVGDPGDDPQALTVGAANVSGNRPHPTAFSGRDVVAGVVKPDVVAPGRHILGVINPDSEIARANPQADRPGGLFIGSGTSEATAVASGVAAAYLSTHRQASPLGVKTALRTGAQGLCDWGSGAGLLTMDGSGSSCGRAHDRSGVDVSADPTGEADWDTGQWQADAWQGGNWESWLASSWSASSWSASSWSASSWSASSWSASSWSASSWSASSWSASSWSASSWSDASWGDGS